MRKRLEDWFAHLNVVPMTIMAVWLNLANALGHKPWFYAWWGFMVVVLVMTSSTAMILHWPDTCEVCVPVRRRAALRAANPHWAVQVFHYGHLMQIAILAYWAWVVPQIFMHPQAVFVLGQLVAVPVILAWGYVCQAHVSRCNECWPPGRGGGPRRRQRPPVGGGMVVPINRKRTRPDNEQRRVALRPLTERTMGGGRWVRIRYVLPFRSSRISPRRSSGWRV